MYYRSLNAYLRETFGCKVYKLALSAGCTCPNRDGTLDARGCIFCSGSGEFAASAALPVSEQLAQAKRLVAAKAGPDCLPPEILALLAELRERKPVWVELGLQTIHASTARYIRRGYPLSVFDNAVRQLKALDIHVVAHMILGLPGETPEMMVQTARYIGQSGADGIKLHLLHVLSGTDLAEDYAAGNFETMTLDAYLSVLEDCLRVLPRELVIHRMTGDGAKRSLIAPMWSADKKRVLNALNRRFLSDDLEQGSALLL